MKPIKDFAASVLQAAQQTAVIEAEPPQQGRVVQRATLHELDTTHQTIRDAIHMARMWADRKRRGDSEASIVLVGPVGTGKTHIARSVLWSICLATEDGQPIAPAGKFFLASDLLLKFSPTSTSWGGVEMPRAADIIGQVPIVVIDDIGAEGTIPYITVDNQEQERQARYFRAIDYCYTWRISLVITSNLSIGQLQKHLGRRCWDRLSEMAPRGFMFDLTGVPSWRQKQSGR